MFVIEEGTEAFATPQQVFANPDTYKVTMAVRSTMETGTPGMLLMVKRNEYMWSIPLPIRQVKGDV